MGNNKDNLTNPPDILVVDDTLANLHLLGDILKKSGYNVRPATNGQLALRSVAARPPDLILLDVRLPDMDGYEICRQLKKDERNIDIPVIFISALGEASEKVEGFEAGGVDYITKPFELREVLARVKTHLRLKKLNERLELEVQERTKELTKANRQLHQEIVERKQAENLLRKSEELYRTLVDNIDLGITLIDKNHRVVMSNAAQGRFFHKNISEFVGRYCFKEFEKRDSICPHCPGVKAMKSGKSEEVETIGVRDDGSKFFVKLRIFPVQGSNDEITGFIEVVEDITKDKLIEKALRKSETELRHLNEELEERVTNRTMELEKANETLSHMLNILEQTQEQLVESEKMAALGNLVAGVAHEINTPVGIVLTAATHLADEISACDKASRQGKLTEQDLHEFHFFASKSISLILSNLNRAIELIKTFKQVAADQASDDLRTINLKEYLFEIMLSLQHQLNNSRHKISVNCPPDVELSTYPGALYQIFKNLIMNSIIHGFREDQEGKITIEVNQDNEHVFIVLHDDGKGMNEEDIKHIFEPFFTISGKGRGSGLGLYIVYNLVTVSLGGQIKCDSKPGEGTGFFIKFPINKEQKNGAGRDQGKK